MCEKVNHESKILPNSNSSLNLNYQLPKTHCLLYKVDPMALDANSDSKSSAVVESSASRLWSSLSSMMVLL